MNDLFLNSKSRIKKALLVFCVVLVLPIAAGIAGQHETQKVLGVGESCADKVAVCKKKQEELCCPDSGPCEDDFYWSD